MQNLYGMAKTETDHLSHTNSMCPYIHTIIHIVVAERKKQKQKKTHAIFLIANAF